VSSGPSPAGREDRPDQMPAHPGRSASAQPGTSPGGWSRATPPARRPRDEIRAPATLVDATFCAIADPGSIPGVSTNFTDCAVARIRRVCRDNQLRAVRRAAHEIVAICGREIDRGSQIGSRLLPKRPRCSAAVPPDRSGTLYAVVTSASMVSMVGVSGDPIAVNSGIPGPPGDGAGQAKRLKNAPRNLGRPRAVTALLGSLRRRRHEFRASAVAGDPTTSDFCVLLPRAGVGASGQLRGAVAVATEAGAGLRRLETLAARPERALDA
jgi:hypothetical protein